jgi:translation elongation factor EF-G
MSYPVLQILVPPESLNENEKLLAILQAISRNYPAFAWEVRPLFAVSLILGYNSGPEFYKNRILSSAFTQ